MLLIASLFFSLKLTVLWDDVGADCFLQDSRPIFCALRDFPGVSAYLIRLRIMNLMSCVPFWVAVAYVTQVWADFQKCSATNAAQSRAEVLQHTLNLAFRDLMRASHFDVTVTVMDATQGVVSPRIALYVSDQPEERDFLCLTRHGTAFSSTPCMAPLRSSVLCSGVPYKSIVLKMVGKQLKGARLRGTHGTGVIIDAMEASTVFTVLYQHWQHGQAWVPGVFCSIRCSAPIVYMYVHHRGLSGTFGRLLSQDLLRS